MSAIITNKNWKYWIKGDTFFIAGKQIAPENSETLSFIPPVESRIIIYTEDIPLPSITLFTLDQLICFINKGGFNFVENLHQDIDGAKINAIVMRSRQTKVPEQSKKNFRLTVLGLGNVGSTLLQGLALLDKTDTGIDEILIHDLNGSQMERWELEANQISSLNSLHPRVILSDFDDTFESDIVAFCIAKYVPDIGEEDSAYIRLSQFEANKKILSVFLDLAMQKRYRGIIAIISDPVDHLTRFSIDYSRGVLEADQFVGMGLGVMYARAQYITGKTENKRLWVAGTHGDLVQVINDVENFDSNKSNEMSKKTMNMNIRIRKTGYKPYVGPAFSSAALSIVEMIREKPFWGAVWYGSGVWGSKLIFRNNAWGWMPIGKDPEIKDLLIQNRMDIEEQYMSL